MGLGLLQSTHLTAPTGRRAPRTSSSSTTEPLRCTGAEDPGGIWPHVKLSTAGSFSGCQKEMLKKTQIRVLHGSPGTRLQG